MVNNSNNQRKKTKGQGAPKPAGQGTSKTARNRRNRKLRSQQISQGQSAVRSKIQPFNDLDHVMDVAKCLKVLTMPEEGDDVPKVTINGQGMPSYSYASKHVNRLSPAECGTGFRVFVFRRPGMNAIISQAPPTSAIWKYAYDFRSQLAPAGSGMSPTGGGNWTFTAQETNQDYPILLGLQKFVSQGAGDFKKHMSDAVTLISRRRPDLSFGYLDAGEQLSFTVASDTTTALTFTALKFDSGGYTRAWSSIINLTGGAGASVYQHTVANSAAEGSDHYAFLISSSSNCTLSSLALSYAGSVGGSSSIHRFVCMNRYCPNIAKLPSGIIIGSSMLCNNGTPDLYKGGECAQANVLASHHWQDLDDYNTIVNLQNSDIREAHEGCFGSLRVNDKNKELGLQTNALVSQGTTLTSMLESIEQDCDYIAIAFNLSDTGGNQIFNLILSTAAEFVPEDPIFKPSFGTTLPSAWEEALYKQRAILQFTANRIHWEQIGKSILKAAETSVQVIRKYGPIVVDVAQTAMKGAEKISGFFGSAAMLGAGFV